MKHLYSIQTSAVWRKKATFKLGVLCGLLLVMLLVNIGLCNHVNTQNADVLLGLVILISTLAGWAALIVYAFGYRPARARAEHMLGILQGEKEQASGILRRTDEIFAIPKSVTVRKIALQQGEETLILHADSALVRQLPPDGTKVTVETVRKFITGYEVLQ